MPNSQWSLHLAPHNIYSYQPWVQPDAKHQWLVPSRSPSSWSNHTTCGYFADYSCLPNFIWELRYHLTRIMFPNLKHTIAWQSKTNKKKPHAMYSSTCEVLDGVRHENTPRKTPSLTSCYLPLQFTISCSSCSDKKRQKTHYFLQS